MTLRHLRHAIIVHSLKYKLNRQHLYLLMAKYPLRFYDVNSKRQVFNYLFDYNAPRTGMFMQYSTSDDDSAMNGVILEASLNSRFNFSFSWFITINDGPEDTTEKIARIFGNLNIMINADVTVAIVKENSFLELYDLYKPCLLHDSPLNIEHQGTWSLRNGFQVKEPYRETFVQRRRNFQNCLINVGITLVNKHSSINLTDIEYLNSMDYVQSDRMQRKTFQLLKLTECLYNYRQNISFLPTWGVEINGTWNGIVGPLITGDIEFSVCPMRFRSDRTRVLRYSSEIHTERISFLLRHPKRTSIRNIFFEPLDNTVWWCIFILIVVTTILLGLHVHAEYQLYWRLKEQSKGFHSTAGDLNFLLLTVLEAIFMQGPDPEQYRYNSTRILLISLSVFSVLLMQFYGAFIVSSLLSETPRTITSLEALYNSNFEIGVENVTYCREILVNAPDEMVHAIYSQRINNGQPNHILPMEQGLERIRRGGFAMFLPTDRAYGLLKKILTQTQFCELQEVGFSTATQQVGIGFSKSTQYKKFISNAIIKFRESSLHQYNEKRWEVPKIDCSVIRDTEVRVDLEHFAPVLVFLAFVTISALGFMFIELLFKRLEEYWRQLIKDVCKTVQQKVAAKRGIK